MSGTAWGLLGWLCHLGGRTAGSRAEELPVTRGPGEADRVAEAVVMVDRGAAIATGPPEESEGFGQSEGSEGSEGPIGRFGPGSGGHRADQGRPGQPAAHGAECAGQHGRCGGGWGAWSSPTSAAPA